MGSLLIPRITSRPFRVLYLTVQYALATLNVSFNPSLTLERLRTHKWTTKQIIVTAANLINAIFWLTIMQTPSFPSKLLIPILYTIAISLPVTSQFFVPASPIFAWLLTYYSARFIPNAYRLHISVNLLPTLESVLYGANISEILTRFTHPVLDIVAWLPYGVLHFVLPFVVAIFLWLFRQKAALKYWAVAFGYMNLAGVVVQILLPCAPPCKYYLHFLVDNFFNAIYLGYEMIYGLTPANYGMPGSPGGLARIDKIFHSHTYTATFSTSPVIFGAFPSLHAGCSTLEALFITHFFPEHRVKIWIYVATLYWATMYLTHHYLIDVVGGACLAVLFFYATMPFEVMGAAATERSPWFANARQMLGMSARRPRPKHEQYDLDQRANGGAYRPDLSPSSSRSSIDGTLPLSSIRSPNPDPQEPQSAVPFLFRSKQKSHRHTASIASLIRADDRVEDGWWSPVTDKFNVRETSNLVPFAREGQDEGPRARSPTNALPDA